MAIYRGAGGSGDAVNDASSEALITIQARDAALAAQAAAEAAQVAAELAETNAETAETNAETAETNAETAETNAAASASAASTSASNAASSASAASTSASNASTSASNAASSASAASTSASNASTSATNAANSATSASNSASTATTQATNASNSASAAATSATNAASSATAAAGSATNAASSATSASGSASTATTQATNAANSATAAATSATNASNSASSASTSATNASNSASAAATSATNASNSASAAATSASNAATSESNAATSASNAAASYDAFDDRYLGAKSSAPTLDNDGNALLTGALYYNTTLSQLYIWGGSAWNAAAFSITGTVTSFNTRTGAVTLSSTDVNNALGFTAQNPNNVAITGGSLDGISIGNTTAATIVKVDNLSLDGNTLASTNSNGNIVLAPNGTGDVQADADTLRVGDLNATATITTNGTGDLVLNTNSGTNAGSITLANGSNGNITLAPNGTGDVYVDADTLRIGDSNSAAVLTTNGTGNLTISTNSGTNSGTVVINQGSNGNIDIAPNGTGRTNVTNLSSTSPRITTGINDSNGNELFLFTATGSAVNEFTVTNGATGTGATLSATGGDTNINVRIAPKGTGSVQELVTSTYYNLASQFDVGTAPNKIPINQYLGALAYVNEINFPLDVGTGITTGTGTICKVNGGLEGGVYSVKIIIDLTGLNSGGTAGDIIGVNGTALPCYIARLPAMTVLGGRMTCLETPAGGDTDIDLYSATEGTGVEDGAISALTETEIINAGTQSRGTVTYFSADPAANAYLYLVGQSTSNATYTAGRFMIEIFGVQ